MKTKNVGDYVFDAEIGSGAYAIVWKGHHVRNGIPVAIKVIRKSSVQDYHSKIRLQREISIMRKLNHSCIVTLFDVFEDIENYYLIMEFLSNGSVLDLVNEKGKLTEKEARHIFLQVVSGLNYLHNILKVAHRDIKCENVLLDDNNDAKIVDFGLSNTFLYELDSLNTKCGSKAYVAPEVIEGKPYNSSVDIWSAGVFLYVMLVGEFPIHHSTSDSSKTTIQYPQFLTHNVIDLLQKMLEKYPEHRISIDQIEIHPWCMEDPIVHYYSNKSLLMNPRRTESLKQKAPMVVQRSILLRQKPKSSIVVPHIRFSNH